MSKPNNNIKRKINNVIAYFYFVLAILVFVYNICIDMFVSFSFTMNVCMGVTALMFTLLYYVHKHPINTEEEPPSFLHTFIKVSAFTYFAIMIGVFVLNITFDKTNLSLQDNYDYIIVFGAGIKEGKNEIINSRLDTAINYAHIYKDAKFALTGARGNDEPIAEAFYMREYMEKRGINSNRILVEPFSRNTYENIVNVYDMIENDLKIPSNKMKYLVEKRDNDIKNMKIGLLSSEFHLTRICLMAEKLGLTNINCIPCHTDKFYLPYMYIRENLSIIKAFIMNQL